MGYNLIEYDKALYNMNCLASENKPFLFVLDFEKTYAFIIENPMGQHEILFDINGITNANYKCHKKNKNIKLEIFPEQIDNYAEKFNLVKSRLMNGASFLTNLTISTPIKMNYSMEDIFYNSVAKYKIYIPNNFVSFSPERFIRINAEGEIYTNPMKGTIDASIPNAIENILNNYKETSEHFTIVDLMRNDINSVASNVKVERFRYIDKIISSNREIYQVSSEISGILPKDYKSNIGNIIDKILPAGSISGAPKEETLKIIKNAEKIKRGFYTGIWGIFDGKSLDSAVSIRFIEQVGPNEYLFRSGGGITVNSEMEDEYNEAVTKIFIPNE